MPLTLKRQLQNLTPIIAIGASAGGLEACSSLLATIPAQIPAAIIVVMHLEPSHKSMLVELLAQKTKLNVTDANDGTTLQAGSVYVIPPGAFLTVSNNTLHISKPPQQTPVRLPYDVLLESLSKQPTRSIACIILSGNGNDGSAGISHVSNINSFVLAQNPDEATYPEMPLHAIQTGFVNKIARLSEMGPVLQQYLEFNPPDKKLLEEIEPHLSRPPTPAQFNDKKPMKDNLAEIIDLIKKSTLLDLKLYKEGTLRRRIERRMNLLGLKSNEYSLYIEKLRSDPKETDQLSLDLLIHVSQFFRDQNVFDHLKNIIIPQLLYKSESNGLLRIWIPGCSTGEEAYSFAIIFEEAIAAIGSNCPFQIFATDVDPTSIKMAQRGVFTNEIEDNVTPERLSLFFTKNNKGWKINSNIRDRIVFSVANLLSDPPFSNIDLVSCRNLLIYLGPEAQKRALARICYSLRPNGYLVLGSAEAPSKTERCFISENKEKRIWRRTNTPAFTYLDSEVPEKIQHVITTRIDKTKSHVKLGEDILLKYHTPPAVLIDSKMLCIYFYGETNKYLQISHGYNTSSILEMLPVDVRQRFAEAANTCIATNSAISVNYINTSGDENTDIILHSIPTKTETLLLTCFITTPTKTIYIHQKQRTNKTDTDNPQNLDTSLARTQQKLNATLDDLKQVTASYTSYKADTIAAQEELLSVNEELLSSKEELQSLNEELTTLNNQLQESLQNQRTTANDLQNVLISTNIATVFLDQKMCIRFFTPAAQRIFAFITTDIGRPITDIASIITDTKLTQDTQDVIRKTKPSIDRELESNNHEWFNRRIQPYREIDSNHTGVVVTYDDITERKRITEALYASIQEADRANSAKSRFLAMASHDLRQPLQALTLLHDLLAKNKQPLEAERLTKLLDNTLKSMTEMLDALLDINRIESGTIFPDIKSIPISDTIKKVADEYRPMCETKGISLRVVYNSAWVNTDPQLIEQIIRNLVSNAVKYTNFGGILIGCLRKGQHVSLRIYDTGIGFDETEREKIFEPYYQIEDPLKSSSEGLGLGLSIVNRLARLLDHQIQVTSQPNQGTCFMISLPISQSMPGLMDDETTKHSRENFPKLKGTILLVEDDPALRDLLNKLISADGHTVFAMTDPNSAIQWASTCKVNPDVLLTDYDLSPGKNGLDLARSIRSIVGKQLPTIILTGDISSDTQRKLTHQNCDVIIKPAAPDLLLKKLNALMGSANENSSHKIQKQEQVKTVVHVIDDDPLVLKTIERLFKSDGFEVVTYKSAEHFLAMPRPTGTACLIVDMMLPKINGLELVELLRKEQSSLPVVMLTGYGDVDAAVSALKAGASNFLEKPAKASELLSSVREAVVTQQQKKARSDVDQSSIEILKRLTKREAEILKEIMKGYSNKIIATKLNVNQRTVENHRASVMRKCRVRSLAELIRLAISAGFS